MTVLDIRDPEYWRALRRREVQPWPNEDPKPSVTTLDPIPDGVKRPKPVSDMMALGMEAGWAIRIGYSRALTRGVKLGTYRDVERWSVWFSPETHTRRPRAVYERFVDSKEILRWTEDGWVTEREKSGTAGTWKWVGYVTAFGEFYTMTVTELKEFLAVKGNVLPGFFDAIVKKQEEAREKAKQSAKNRTKKTEDGG